MEARRINLEHAASVAGSALPFDPVRALLAPTIPVGPAEARPASPARRELIETWYQQIRRWTAEKRAVAGAHPLPEPRRPSRLYPLVKRALDVALAGIGLLLAAPLLAVLALLVKWDTPGPVFFGHVRVGKGGRKFRCWKLRTMTADATDALRRDPGLRARYVQNHFKVPIEEDPRVTRMGRFLRKWSLDELPQLWNVLVGEMSLVGPRPIVEEELSWYGSYAREFLSVRPGLTGAWQIMGRNRIGYPHRAFVELGYIRQRSLWREWKTLILTLPAVITARGCL